MRSVPGIKRLYSFMLQTFIPLFMMTFFICLFIVMMQFLWKYIDEMVGKGLSMGTLSELFFYAALSMIPLALPLAILLASLMTFGNLGEHFELTAMKSSGISLFRVMRPLIALIVVIAIAAFFFQNDVLPQSQVKMWTLMFSVRQKSPTIDIPEGAVYTQIPGYNLYVKHKSREEGNPMMYDMMIYDTGSTGGMNYPRVVACDSGSLSMTPDRKHIVLRLYDGNWYEELRAANANGNGLSGEMYRREAFKDKEILIPYDATFTRMDDETMRSQYVGKNIKELRQTIDSVNVKVDSAGNAVAREMRSEHLMGVAQVTYQLENGKRVAHRVPEVKMERPIDFDSLFNSLPLANRQNILKQAKINLDMRKQNYEFRGYTMEDDRFIIRRHEIELQRKFTLSLACLIFFFIGAPLGAIIRKGGFGTPIVISVILFIIYYIIDNMGYKMARDGRWPVWQGMWLSSAVLLPLGVFLTKKAINDSAVFNPDAWRNALRRLTGMHATRHYVIKDVIIEEVDAAAARDRITAVRAQAAALVERYAKRQSFVDYWTLGVDRKALAELTDNVNSLADYLANSRDQQVLNKAMDLPVFRRLLTYCPSAGHTQLGYVMAAVLPLSVPFYLVGLRHQSNLKGEFATTVKTCDELDALLAGEGISPIISSPGKQPETEQI